MTAVLANIAGVEEVFLSFPPSNKEVTDLMLASCHIGGVTEAISIGGAQAIAAMAFGTESIKKVDKIEINALIIRKNHHINLILMILKNLEKKNL